MQKLAKFATLATQIIFIFSFISLANAEVINCDDQNKAEENKALRLDNKKIKESLNAKSKNEEKVQRADLESEMLISGVAQEDKIYSEAKSTLYISEEDIKRFTPVSIGDLLKGQPGVHVGDVRNGGGLDVNIRGIQGQGRIAITVDDAQQALNVYRGYAGTSQRSYVDPDLLTQIRINKGADFTMETGTSGIGGSVAMQTLGIKDVISKGNSFGVRLTGQIWDNGINAKVQKRLGSQIFQKDSDQLNFTPRKHRTHILNAKARAASIAVGYTTDKYDTIFAVAKRQQGNYFAGSRNYSKYKKFDRNGIEQNSVAKFYNAGEEVLNTSADTRSILWKNYFKFGNNHKLNFIYNNYYAELGEIMPSDIYRYGKENGIHQYPFGITNMNMASLKYKYQPANPWLDLTATLWLSNTKTEQLNKILVPKSQEYVTDRGWAKLENNRIGLAFNNASQINTNAGDFNMNFATSLQYEKLAPQSDVIISDVDRYANRNYRNAKRIEYAINSKFKYQPLDNLTFWANLDYHIYSTKDLNREAVPIKVTKKLKRIYLTKTVDGFIEYAWLNWYPDKHGNYTQATDPRKNNAIAYKDEINPFDGVTYKDFAAENEEIKPEGIEDVVVGYKLKKHNYDVNHGIGAALGIKYEFWQDMFLYTSFTQGVRMPSLFETAMGTPQVKPGKALKPEIARNFEVGLSLYKKAAFSDYDKIGFKVAYFFNYIKNYVTRYYEQGKNGIMKFANTDSYRVDGLEMQAKYDIKYFFTDLSSTIYFNTITCDKTFAESLRQIPNDNLKNTPDCTPGSFMGSYINTQNPPKFSINFTGGFRFFDEAWTIGTRVIYSSGPTAKIYKAWQSSPTTPQIYYAPVTNWDIFTNYKFSEKAQIDLSIQNVMNNYYLDALAQSYMPAPGITTQLGFKLKY